VRFEFAQCLTQSLDFRLSLCCKVRPSRSLVCRPLNELFLVLDFCLCLFQRVEQGGDVLIFCHIIKMPYLPVFSYSLKCL
jgi:hypothetical protein